MFFSLALWNKQQGSLINEKGTKQYDIFLL